MPAYTVHVEHPARDLSDADLAALGPHYTPDPAGERSGRLRLSASTPDLAAEIAATRVSEVTGVEVTAWPPTTWAGPTWSGPGAVVACVPGGAAAVRKGDV